MAEGAMTSMLSNIGEFATKSIEWLGDVWGVVTSDPALTVLVIGMPVVGFAAGLLGRLIRL